MNDFNAIAPVYDFLKRLVFGQSIFWAAASHLNLITENCRVLVLGGGTGYILPHIRAKQIDYVELSSKMLALAKERVCPSPITFYCQSFETFESTHSYDIVVCEFFLDLFDQHSLGMTLLKIKELLSPGGNLIVTDFEKGNRFWKISLSALMHLFFRLTANLQSRSLSSIHEVILKNGFICHKETLVFYDFIFSRAYASDKTSSLLN